MKKRIKILVAVAAVATGTLSCTNLEEKVYSNMTAENYFANFSEDDIPAAVGKIYYDLRKLYAGHSVHTEGCWLYTNEEVGDVWLTPKRGGAWYDAGVYYRLNGHTWAYDDAHILNNWQKAYACINDCNRLIYQFENADIANPAKLMSGLRVGRAFWYYVLCDMYGNVPLVTRYDVPDGFLPESATRQQIFDFVVEELEANIENLENKSYGRWDKYSATCLLAKMYINAEAWGVSVDGNAWQKTIDCCNTIINSNLYGLESDYKAPFVTENENSKEIIMGVVNDEVYHKYGNNDAWTLHLCTMHWKYCYHANTVTQYWGGCCATPEFAQSYDSDDLRYAKSWLEGQLYDNTGAYTGTVGSMLYCDPWDSRDVGKPLYHTKEIPLFEGDAIPTTGEAPGVRMLKYEIKTGCMNSLSNDFVLFRYADVLFMKAEAMWRKNNKVATQEIVDIINDVRERAFTNFTDAKKLHIAELDDERFLQEYAWEFCTEGYRRQQLIRFGAFTTKTWFLHDTPSESYRKLFPIPRAELLANKNLTQNEGYPRP